MTRFAFPLLCLIFTALGTSSIAQTPTFTSVAEIQTLHDRALIKDLVAYLAKTPKPEDVDQAYLTLFNKVIEHDWFFDHESIAKTYLKNEPTGAVRSLAQIIATMGRAQAGAFAEALVNYQALLDGLKNDDQVEFAANFADSLASVATTAGEFEVSRKVFTALMNKYGAANSELKEKVSAQLARLDLVGKPAPFIEVKDLDGKSFRLGELKGKYVLVDFWATWCAPCLAEMPGLQAAHAAYRAKGFEVVSVSLDETKGPVVDFVRTRKIPWIQIHNATAAGDLVQAFGVTEIPAAFLIDPQGTIVRLELRGAALEKALKTMIK